MSHDRAIVLPPGPCVFMSGDDAGPGRVPRGDVTRLLAQLGDGDATAWQPLMEIVYDELRQLAHARLRLERDSTLGTTALVHEAWLRLAGIEDLDWQDRRHFFAVAASAMRRLLIDRARAAHRQKRGGRAAPMPLSARGIDALAASVEERADELIALDEALDRLGALSDRQRRVVELRFFAGLTLQETADTLGVALNTAKRDWTTARLFLNRELST